jgi:hypothetical protein
MCDDSEDDALGGYVRAGRLRDRIVPASEQSSVDQLQHESDTSDDLIADHAPRRGDERCSSPAQSSHPSRQRYPRDGRK